MMVPVLLLFCVCRSENETDHSGVVLATTDQP